MLATNGSLAVLVLAVLMLAGAGPVGAQEHFRGGWPDTDFERALVDLQEIRGGGPPKDGIPAIDAPQFDSVEAATTWIDPLEPVITLSEGDGSRAYPLQILMYHEIVNDVVNDRPIAVTFCPLCNASIVFDRRFEGRLLDFGTTGLLRKSDLVMYDRQTESWWQQFSGRAIVGELAGSVLARIPSAIVSFAAFAVAHPGGEVLNRDTGHRRPYGRNPYAGYDDINSTPFLLGEKPDGRLPPMERVLGISHDGKHRIYPFDHLEEARLVNDHFAGLDVVVLAAARLRSALDLEDIAQSRTVAAATAWNRDVDGRVLTFSVDGEKVVDDATGSTWNALGQATSGPMQGAQLRPLDGGVHFAFAWLAFNPDTEIYAPQ